MPMGKGGDKDLDAAAKELLVINYYNPSRFQGVIMRPNGVYCLNTFKKKPFSLNINIKKHIESKGMNLAVIFPKDKTHIMAFDLDSDDILYDVILSGDKLIEVIKELGFKPIVYVSGGKGIHIEVRFSNEISCNELRKLAKIIKILAEKNGCQYIDKVYPSGSAYRPFGCRHYKTNVFTGIIKNTMLPQGIESSRILLEGESWNEFNNYVAYGCRVNTINKVEKALIKYHDVKPNIKSKRKKEPFGEGSVKKEIHYSIKALEQIHTQGLYSNYTRYYTSYQLGRYFKEVLHLTEGQARAEINNWLSRHYRTSLNYFGDAAGSKIKSAYNKCVKETIDNCMRGYANGQSITPKQIITFKRKTEKYVDDLKITKPQKAALRYLIRTAEGYNSLSFYHSYDQLGAGFKLKEKDSIKAYIDKFIKLGLIKIISKGSIIGGKNIATTYEIIIPAAYYDIEVIANDKPEALPQKKVHDLCRSNKTNNVHHINTNVHNDINKNSHKPIW